MANNKAIQFLRGTRDNIVKNKNQILEAGQPLYNLDDNYLTIGNGEDGVDKLPITVREVKGYFGDKENIVATVSVYMV